MDGGGSFIEFAVGLAVFWTLLYAVFRCIKIVAVGLVPVIALYSSVTSKLTRRSITPRTFEALGGEPSAPPHYRRKNSTDLRISVLPTHAVPGAGPGAAHSTSSTAALPIAAAAARRARTARAARHNLELFPGSLRLTTGRLNAALAALGGGSGRGGARRLRAAAWRVWFTCGVAFGTAALAAGCVVVLAGLAEVARDDLGLRLPSPASMLLRPASQPPTPDWADGDGGGGGKGSLRAWDGDDDGGAAEPLGRRRQPHHHAADCGEQLDIRRNASFTYSTGPALDRPASISGHTHFLVSLIPGVNLPIYALGYYFVALLISVVVHEAGHAVAAAAEGVPVESVGLFVAVVFPGAFVELDEAELGQLEPLRRLRIVCAGAWHNWVAAMCAWGALASLPLWLAWGYRNLDRPGSNGGVVVLETLPDSPLYGHLPVGSIVTALDDFEIDSGVAGWEEALYRSLVHDPRDDEGYCIPRDYIRGDSSSPLQCFVGRDVLAREDGLVLSANELFSSEKACLNVQETMRVAPRCRTSADCLPVGSAFANASAATDADACLAPYVSHPHVRIVRVRVVDRRRPAGRRAHPDVHRPPPQQHQQQLPPAPQEQPKKLRRRSDGDASDASQLAVPDQAGPVANGGDPLLPNADHRRRDATPTITPSVRHGTWRMYSERTVLFLGDPREILEAVHVGSLVTRFSFLPEVLPYYVERLLHFLISFNVALSILNMVPAPFLDGHQALAILADAAAHSGLVAAAVAAIASGGRRPRRAAVPARPNDRAAAGVAGVTLALRKRRVKDAAVLWVGRIAAGALGCLVVAAVVRGITGDA
ncbi:Membrane-bound transcription factor site-2 protease [Cladochytrium tenue]|nr:Membrane-bound transcription factor site-2 protease [Cladochytrium tenue]